MDFDFRSRIEDESVNGSQANSLLLILGLTALFILPTLFYTFLYVIFSSVDQDLLTYIAYFFGYGTYIAVLFKILGKDKIKKIIKGFDLNNLYTAFIFAIILYLASTLTSTLVNVIFKDVGSNANQESLDQSMVNYPIIVSIFSVIFAPIVEELVFRFTIFKPLAQKNKVLAYCVSVLTFAGIHFISSLSVLMTDLANPELTQEIAYSSFFDDLKTLPIYIVAALVLTFSYDLNNQAFEEYQGEFSYRKVSGNEEDILNLPDDTNVKVRSVANFDISSGEYNGKIVYGKYSKWVVMITSSN